MSTAQQVLLFSGLALGATATLGTLVRARYRLYWSFCGYLLAVTVATALIGFWPQRFHTPGFWQVKETAYMALRFAMAAELAYRTFRLFPGARAALDKTVLLILLVTLAAVLTAPRGTADEAYPVFIRELQPRVLNGSVWILTTIAGLILWYRLPVHPFHKAILLSYVPYVLVFTVALGYLGDAGWARGRAMIYLNQVSYAALLAYWNYVIWRRDPAPSVARSGRGSAAPRSLPASA